MSRLLAAPSRGSLPTPADARRPASLSVASLLLLSGVLLVASAVADLRRQPGVSPASGARPQAPLLVRRSVGAGGRRGACRVTASSPQLATDDRGYSCRAEDVIFPDSAAVAARTGCCNTSAADTARYSCRNCDSVARCCSQYESCVSCCMTPGTTVLFGPIVRGMARHPAVDPYDLFAVCQGVCRTNSRSVEHENAYKHHRHHCFGIVSRPSDPMRKEEGVGGVFDFLQPFPALENPGGRLLKGRTKRTL